MTDLLTDKVTLKRYKCFSEDCRKTFDHPIELFSHVKVHVLTYNFLNILYSYGKKNISVKLAENHTNQRLT